MYELRYGTFYLLYLFEGQLFAFLT